MYELVIVGTVDGAAALFEKVEKFLKEASAQNVKSEKMGKKVLAYPIAKQTEAEYMLFNFDADPSEILQLDRKIRLEQETVLRHLLIKVKPTRAKKASRLAKVKETVEEPKVEKAKAALKVTVTTTSNVAKAKSNLASAKVATSKKTIKPVKSKAAKKGTSKK